MQELILFFSENITMFYVCIGLFSLCIGSFLNVVIYRTPKIMEQEWKKEYQAYFFPNNTYEIQQPITLSLPASTCPKCHSKIRWYHNIPVLSWLFLKGKCNTCQNPISFRYPFIELLTCICSLIVVATFGVSLHTLFGLVFTWILITLTFIDFDTQLLPDHLTYPLAGLGLAVNSYFFFTTPTLSIWGTLLGFLSLWSVATLYKIIRKNDGMGAGDFKLLAALGAWVGPLLLPLIILLSSVLGSIIGVILLKTNKESRPFAFGPYIAIAGWIALLWGEKIMKIYLGNL